jgi:hypothetical protein
MFVTNATTQNYTHKSPLKFNLTVPQVDFSKHFFFQGEQSRDRVFGIVASLDKVINIQKFSRMN